MAVRTQLNPSWPFRLVQKAAHHLPGAGGVERDLEQRRRVLRQRRAGGDQIAERYQGYPIYQTTAGDYYTSLEPDSRFESVKDARAFIRQWVKGRKNNPRKGRDEFPPTIRYQGKKITPSDASRILRESLGMPRRDWLRLTKHAERGLGGTFGHYLASVRDGLRTRESNPRKSVSFTTDKHGRPIAYLVSMQQMRNFRIPLDEAKLMVETGEADEVPYRRFSEGPAPPGKFRAYRRPEIGSGIPEHRKPGFTWGWKSGVGEANPDPGESESQEENFLYFTSAEFKKIFSERLHGFKSGAERHGHVLNIEPQYLDGYIIADNVNKGWNFPIRVYRIAWESGKLVIGDHYRTYTDEDYWRLREDYLKVEENPASDPEISAAAQVAAEQARAIPLRDRQEKYVEARYTGPGPKPGHLLLVIWKSGAPDRFGLEVYPGSVSRPYLQRKPGIAGSELESEIVHFLETGRLR